MQLPLPPQPGECPPDVSLAIRAWNLLGGIEWSGLQLVAEMLGYDDMEILVRQLETIRDFQKASA